MVSVISVVDVSGTISDDSSFLSLSRETSPCFRPRTLNSFFSSGQVVRVCLAKSFEFLCHAPVHAPRVKLLQVRAIALCGNHRALYCKSHDLLNSCSMGVTSRVQRLSVRRYTTNLCGALAIIFYPAGEYVPRIHPNSHSGRALLRALEDDEFT